MAVLSRVEATFEGLLEAAPDAMLGVDRDGVIRFVNRQTEVLFGYDRSELVGHLLEMLVPENFRMHHAAHRTGYFAEPSSRAMGAGLELSGRRKDGSEFPVDISLASLVTDDGLLVTAAVRDITERKKAEATILMLNAELEDRVEQRTAELAEAVEELEAFSYSVSHDLRAPLRHVDGFSRILLDEYGDSLDSEGQRLLQVIRQATNNMGNLIDDLLEFSRVGRQAVRMGEIDMDALWDSVAREAEPTYAGRDVELVIAPLPTAQGDRSLIKQVVVNVLSNAIKYTGFCEHARIEVTGTVDGDMSVYSVKDNGVGFDKAYEEKLFQVFQRLHPKEFEGTGVGLALVQRIVQRHGGRVWADGAVGEGATFSFALPAAGRSMP